MINIAKALESVGVDSVDDLRSLLSGDEHSRRRVRNALYSVHGVGRKTVDYFDLLVGISDGVAIDSRIRKTLGKAGITDVSPTHASAVLRQAAEAHGWTPAQMGGLLWSHGAR